MEYNITNIAKETFRFYSKDGETFCLEIRTNNELLASFRLIREEFEGMVFILSKMLKPLSLLEEFEDYVSTGQNYGDIKNRVFEIIKRFISDDLFCHVWDDFSSLKKEEIIRNILKSNS